MLDKKNAYIAEALDEIRDEYIEEAVTYDAQTQEDEVNSVQADWNDMQMRTVIGQDGGKCAPDDEKEMDREFFTRKRSNVHRIAGTVAACLVVLIALGLGVRFLPSSENEMAAATGSAEQTVESAVDDAAVMDKNGSENGGPSDLTEAAGEAAPADGSVESGENSEYGQLGNQSSGNDQQELVWYEPEEIFAQDIIIVRGTVESMISVVGDPIDGGLESSSYTQLTVKVSECLKGDLEAGESCVIKIPVTADYQNYYDDFYGDLTRLSEGSEAIFMPHVGEPYYFDEGRRYLFLETMEGVSYAEEVYEIASKGTVTLDDVEAYIREMLADVDKDDDIVPVE